MRISVLTVGSRGDIQQCVALALGLRAAGHEVCLGTHAEFEPFVREYGLAFAEIPGNLFTGLNAGLIREPKAGEPVQRRMDLAIEQWMLGGVRAAAEADLLIYSQLFFVGQFIAERLRIPAIAANYTPITPTRAFPAAFSRSARNLGGPLNLLTHWLDQQAFWQRMRPLLNRLRSSVLELPPLPFAGPYAQMQRSRQPVLYAFSPRIVPKPRDWPDWVHVTGFWFLGSPAGWQPPADLVAFLEAGPPPIYLGFGSVANSNPHRVTHAVLTALARLGQRVLVMPGQVDLTGAELPPETFVVRSVPHDWLFPRVRAVIHHGGVGTTATALRAGVPALGIPFFGDQYFWSRRINAVGAGPAPVAREQVTVDTVLPALRALAEDDELRERAANLGREIAAEDGVARAVHAIERSFAGPLAASAGA